MHGAIDGHDFGGQDCSSVIGLFTFIFMYKYLKATKTSSVVHVVGIESIYAQVGQRLPHVVARQIPC